MLISQLTSSCVSFTIYQQCHGDIVGDVTPISLQYCPLGEVKYLRNIVSKEELTPDPEKVKTIFEIPQSENKQNT